MQCEALFDVIDDENLEIVETFSVEAVENTSIPGLLASGSFNISINNPEGESY